MKKPYVVITLFALGAATVVLNAQAQSSIGDVRRAIEDSTSAARERAIGTTGQAGIEASFAIDNLAVVEVLGSSPLTPAIERYWLRFVGKPVSNDDLLDFKLWFSEESKKSGSLAFVSADGKLGADGRQVLVLSLASPKIQSVKLLVGDASVATRYKELLTSRLSKDFVLGAGLDIDGLDQRLERISFDLPLNLEATVRPVGPELVDLLVSVNEVDRQPGKIKRAVLQFNNHGLKQFGREQWVGLLSVGGFAPHASASATVLASEGLRFGRLEYETPIAALSGRVRVFASYSHSQSVLGGDAATKGLTKEAGIGLMRQENNWGDLMLRSGFDAVARRSINRLAVSNAETGNIQDTQIRINFSLDNERVRRFPMSLEGTVSIGHLSPSSLDTVAAGRYHKLDVRGSFSRPFTTDGRWFSVLKGRAQLVSRNVDSYNKISIGGNQGVRAYTSADGVGDVGAVGAFEVNRRFGDGVVAGFFYDVGRIDPSKTLVSGAFDQVYSLQSVGVHLSGDFAGWQYSGHVGKGLGGYKLAEQEATAAASKSNPLRVSLAVSRSF
jgi:hypothetical protein